MKRIIVAIVFFALSLTSFSQTRVQNSFFGISISTQYEVAKEKMKELGFLDMSGNRQELKYYDIRFGGWDWPFCTMSFNSNRLFYRINFSSNFNDKEEAIYIFSSLSQNLELKYGTPVYMEENSETDKYLVFGDNGDIKCHLSISYSESKGGEMYYYCQLTYSNSSLSNSFDEL